MDEPNKISKPLLATPPNKAPTNIVKPRQPPLSILQKVHNDPKFTTARSVDWFRKKINELGGAATGNRAELVNKTKPIQVSRFLVGSLFIFRYDPKFKDELPYYDKFPCSLIFSVEADIARGINFHYLPIPFRAKLFDKLWQIASIYRNNLQQCKKLTWKLLGNVAKFPEVRVAVKSYLYTHLQSRLIKVEMDDWKTAMLLPVEYFVKKPITTVYYDSRKNIANVIAGKPMTTRAPK